MRIIQMTARQIMDIDKATFSDGKKMSINPDFENAFWINKQMLKKWMYDHKYEKIWDEMELKLTKNLKEVIDND